MAIRDGINLEENTVFLLIGDYLADKNFEAIRETIQDFHAADKAFLLNLFEEDDILAILTLLPEREQAEVIKELSESKQEFVVNNLEKGPLAKIVENLESDDAADLMELLDKPVQEQILDKVDQQDAKDLRELLKHEPDSAGGIMSKEVVVIPETANVEETIQEIRKAAVETEQIYNVFIVSEEDNELKGILPLNKLVLSSSDVRVTNLMEDTVSVQASLDQEQVAKIVKKYDLVEIPVVDEGNRLVGRITHDDIIDVIEEEAEEDIARLAGTNVEEPFEHSPFEISKSRISWLLIGLLGGIFAAVIISQFELTLDKQILFAFFVPVIMAMGGIVGIQSSTITVRALATGEIQPGQLVPRIKREIIVGLINGTICSLIITGLVFIWQLNISLALVVGCSMGCVMMMSTLSGTLIPIVLNNFKVDPGIATGPFVTTLNDVIGLLVYFGLASLLIFLKGGN